MDGQGDSSTNSDCSSLVNLIDPKANVCKYTSLSEAELMYPPGTANRKVRVNVAGVVYWFKELCPPARGRDYFLSFSIIDPSCSSTPVQVTVFRRDKASIPPINRIGCIVLLKNIEIGRFNDKMQLKCPFFSTCNVFQLNPLSPWQLPDSTPASLTSVDVHIVHQLRAWINDDASTLSKVSNPVKKLSEVTPGDVFDLICTLCHVQVIDHLNVAIVTVTDGTVPRFVTASTSNTPTNEHYKQYSQVSVSIFFYDVYISKSIQALTPGEFMYLSMVVASPAKLCSGPNGSTVMDHVVLHVNADRNVAFSVLSQSDPDVVTIVKTLSECIGVTNGSPSRSPVRISSITSSTVSLESNRAITSISEVLECTAFPARFRLNVQPIKISVERIEDISHLYCYSCCKSFPIPTTPTELEDPKFKKPLDLCENCVDSNSDPLKYPLSYIIYFTITVKDSTGELDLAVVIKANSSSFLPGVKPGNLYLDHDTRKTALCHLKKVFSYDLFDSTHLMPGARPSPPVMDCTVDSSLQKNKDLFTPLHVISDTFLLHDSNNQPNYSTPFVL